MITPPPRTRAGRRLLFMFMRTEVERIIRDSIDSIETEAYATAITDFTRDHVPNIVAAALRDAEEAEAIDER